jgi:hypothetical protein
MKGEVKGAKKIGNILVGWSEKTATPVLASFIRPDFAT